MRLHGLSAVWLALAVAGCHSDTLTVPSVDAPYIAIVMQLSAPAGFSYDGKLTYHVVAHSEGVTFDKTVRATPRDTVILPVSPGDYQIDVEGLPSRCETRYGFTQYIPVFETDNTAIVRWNVSCRDALRIRVATDGHAPDDAYIYRILDDVGNEVGYGQIASTDSVSVDPLPKGRFVVQLFDVAPNCVATNDGGEAMPVDVPSGGGASIQFYIRCSDEAKRPRVLFYKSSYMDGASGFVVKLFDPNKDVESYFWDITDCRGKSILPKGGRTRRNLSANEARGRDTVLITAAYEVGLTREQVAGRCTLIRVTDFDGNATATLEDPIDVSLGGQPPNGVDFNARFVTTAVLRTQVTPIDPDGDFVGAFGSLVLRDGTFGPVDGNQDIVVFNLIGTPDARFPDVPLGTGGVPPFGEFVAVIVYLFDARGNMTRLVDGDLMQ